MVQVTLRFHAELNDFLSAERRQRELPLEVDAAAPLRHVLECCGVPHTEVAEVLCDGRAVSIEAPVGDNRRFEVYPWFEAGSPNPASRRIGSSAAPRFIADAHLGRLARQLRMLGFDTLWSPEDPGDARLAELTASEDRMLLSSDRRLLMRRRVTRGCFIRAGPAWRQLAELVVRLQLCAEIRPFTRCMRCNAPLSAVPLAQVRDQVPPRVRELTDRYWRCDGCRQVYWRGTHWRDMRQRLRRLCPGTGAETGSGR